MLRANIDQKLSIPLTDEEYAWFRSLMQERTVRKKELLIREGDLCASLYFVEQGALFSSLTDETGEIHVIQFGFEGYWISETYSFYSGKPALFNVEALEDCQLLGLSRHEFEVACDKYPKVDRFFRILAQNAYMVTQHRLARMFSTDTEARYLDLIERNPGIVQRVPQYLVASFLGVKPQSLSRIRKQIFEKR